MAKDPSPPTDEDVIEVDLREPGRAALYAWLWPGAGHLYQRRYAKGILFMVCILGTYFFGLALGGGQCVYASISRNDFRWQYFCQLGVGAPAFPAVVQYVSVMNSNKPILVSWMAPPKQPVDLERHDQLAEWHLRYNSGFELGTLYTVIAGLLNILAIYDAYAGPMTAAPEEEKKPPDKDKDKDKKKE
jgi:hypothetical protein